MTHDVFISYSSKDKLIADATLAVLEQNAIRCWIAPRDITPGMNWGASVMEAINHARIMVLVFSENANKSQQIEREIERAVHRAITIIPMRIANITPEKSLEYFLSSQHWFDAFPPPPEKHLQKLAETVRSVLALQYEGRASEELRTDAGAAQQDRTATAKGGSSERRMDGGAQQPAEQTELSPKVAERVVDAAERARGVAWSVRFRARVIAAVVVVVVIAGSAAILFKPRALPPSAEAVFLFDKDQVVLPQSASLTIDREAAFLQDNPKVTVTIKAYCSDDEGARVGPKTLAVLRANAVRNALKARGIIGSRVTAESGCQADGATASGDAAAEAENRRAILVRN
jgi:outer membrane protein OmpA-like peptidoglycan-associated protein